MKLQTVAVENVLGIKHAQINLKAPALLLAGKNGAGKSSLGEAIRHAIEGVPVRIELKKEFAALVHEGAKAGSVSVEFDTGAASLALPSGKHEQTAITNGFLASYCLDPQMFAKSSNEERRTILFNVCGVKLNAKLVKERLIARGVDASKAELVTPLLAAGFSCAATEAAGKATEAKGAWRSTTGETYGSKKAEVWTAHVQDSHYDIPATDDLSALDADIEAAQIKLGELRATAAQAAAQAATLADCRAKAERYARIQEKLTLDEAGLKHWEQMVEETAAKAEGVYVEPHTHCPHCGGIVQVHGAGAAATLKAYALPEDDQRPDQEAKAKLPEYIATRDLMRRAVENGKRDLAASNAAAERLAELEQQAGAAPDETALAKAQGELNILKGKRKTAQAAHEAANAARRATAEAEAKTAKAAEHHADVLAWSAIADALSPDGIPAELLAEAMGPFNAALANHSDMAGWPWVQVNKEMEITLNGRAYRLLSESEKWRCDATIAAAIAQLSGIKFVLLDRFDVLDTASRGKALYWVNDAIADGMLDSALVIGTLKSMPSALPDNFDGCWLENGTTETQKIAA